MNRTWRTDLSSARSMGRSSLQVRSQCDLTFLCQGIHQANGGGCHLADVDVVIGQFQLALFDLGDVENLVDQAQQMFAAEMDVVDVFPITFVFDRAHDLCLHGLGKTDDGVQRCVRSSWLMLDMKRDFAWLACSSFRLAATSSCSARFALGDVDHDRLQGTAIFPIDDADPVFQPDLGAVMAHATVLITGRNVAASLTCLAIGGEAVLLVGRFQARDILQRYDAFGIGEAVNVPISVVAEENPVVAMDHHALDRCLHQRTEPRFTGAQLGRAAGDFVLQGNGCELQVALACASQDKTQNDQCYQQDDAGHHILQAQVPKG